MDYIQAGLVVGQLDNHLNYSQTAALLSETENNRVPQWTHEQER